MDDFDDLARRQRIGLDARLQARWHELDPAGADGPPQRVTEVQRDAVRLHDGSAETRARVRPALRAALDAEGDALAVGDWVLATCNAFGEWWVHARLPPLNQLARRLHDGRDKVDRTVIVSNVDTALLVMGLDPDFNLRRLERCVALVRLAGIGAVVVLTKADRCADTAARLAAVQRLLPADIEAFAADAREPALARQLQPWTGPGRTLVAIGSSGAGKSTLANTLLGAQVQPTGATRAGDGRGRHTTTARSLHVIPGGACLIDTPGLRTLRLDGEAGALAAAFDDIGALALHCRFRDCRHQGEPGCAVRDAVGSERLRNYHKLRRESERDQLSALERRAQVQQWKVRARAARERARDKR